MKRLTALLLLLPAMLLPGHTWAGKAHEHGVVKIDIAVESKRITLQMESPLDNLLAFERAPRTDAERKSVDALVSRLRAADALFKIAPAAQCTLSTVVLSSAVLKLGPAEPNAAPDGHADIDASFEFACKDGALASFIDVTLFDAFVRIRRVDVQAVTPTSQFKRTLNSMARRVLFVR